MCLPHGEKIDPECLKLFYKALGIEDPNLKSEGLKLLPAASPSPFVGLQTSDLFQEKGPSQKPSDGPGSSSDTWELFV